MFGRGVLVCVVLGCTFPAWAWKAEKDFSFKMFPQGSLKPSVAWTYKAEAMSQTLSAISNPPARSGKVAVTAPSTDTKTVTADLRPDAFGEAKSWYTLFGPGPAEGERSGRVGVEGSAYILPLPLFTGVFASSAAKSEIGWQWTDVNRKTGELRWVGMYHRVATTAGPAKTKQSQSIRDPIDIRFFDRLTDDVLFTDSFFDVFMELSGDGDGSMTLDSGKLIVDTPAGAGTVHINAGSDYTDVRGSLELAVNNGVVTGVNTTGVFAGTMPALGSPAQFVANIGLVDLKFDYDRVTPQTVNAELRATVEGSGAVPEPSGAAALLIGSALTVFRSRKQG